MLVSNCFALEIITDPTLRSVDEERTEPSTSFNKCHRPNGAIYCQIILCQSLWN